VGERRNPERDRLKAWRADDERVQPGMGAPARDQRPGHLAAIGGAFGALDYTGGRV
jgi:hypothetical protein